MQAEDGDALRAFRRDEAVLMAAAELVGAVQAKKEGQVRRTVVHI